MENLAAAPDVHDGRPLRWLAIVEGLTYLVLMGAVITYRVFDGPNWISAIGPVHGIAFLGYFLAVLHAREARGWTLTRTVSILFFAVVPIGGFIVADRLARETNT